MLVRRPGNVNRGHISIRFGRRPDKRRASVSREVSVEMNPSRPAAAAPMLRDVQVIPTKRVLMAPGSPTLILRG